MSTVNIGSSLPAGSNILGQVKLVDTGGVNQLAIDANNNAHVTLYNAANAMAIDSSNNAHVGVWNGANQLAVNASGNAAINLLQVGSATVTLGSKTSANSFPVVIASDQGSVKINIDQTTICTTNGMVIVNNNTGSTISAEIAATKRLRVQMDSTQVFYEAWDSGTVETTYNWNAAITGGNGSSTPSAGQEILSSGTTANGYAYLTSKNKFQPVSPGYLQFDHQIQFTFALPAHTYAYWGAGTVPATPTSAAPLTDAVAFELATNGKMSAVCYAGGTRNSIQDLSSSTGNSTQPADANVHKYEIYIRGDNMYWLIDNQSVASISTGALGPNTNLLPIMLLSGVDATGASSAQQLTSAAVYVGDTSKAFFHISDPTHPQYAVTVKPGSTAIAATDPSLAIGFSPNSPLPTGSNTIGAVTQASGPWSENLTQIAGSSIATAATGVQKIGIVGSGGATIDSTIGAGTAPTNAIIAGSTYNSSAPAPTTGQAMALQADQAGNLREFPGIALTTLAAWTTSTTVNTTQTIFTNSGAPAVLIQLNQTTTITVGAITFEVTFDGTNWVTATANCIIDPTSATYAQIALPYTLQASTNKAFIIDNNGWQGLRIKLSTAMTGTGSVTPFYALLPYDPVDSAVVYSPTAANFNVTAVQSGTWLVQSQAGTTGGSTASHTISAASTNATSTKASAGLLYGFCVSNTNAAARFVKFYNKASAPTVGTDTPVLTVQVPPNSTVIRAYPEGLTFSTGIAWAATGAITDADTTAIGLSDLSVDLNYK